MLVEGLRRTGFRIDECVQPSWGSTAQRVEAARRGVWNPRLIARLARSYARLARDIRRAGRQPTLLVGYPGQLDTLVLRWLMPRARIVLDAFIGLDETLADRRIGSARSASRRAARILDRIAFRFADLTIVDTAAHARRFAALYGLDLARTVVAAVGAMDPGPLPAPLSSMGPRAEGLRVLYFGGFVPLHGVPTVVEAARLIAPTEGITFDLVGDGQDAGETEHDLFAAPLPHVHLQRAWMPERELIAQHVAGADVCLGIFGNGSKAMDVVPAKLHLALACARATVTANSPAVREEVLARGDASDPPVLVCPPADPAGLAASLRRLRDDPGLRERTARSGRRVYEEHFRPERIVGELCERLRGLAEG